LAEAAVYTHLARSLFPLLLLGWKLSLAAAAIALMKSSYSRVNSLFFLGEEKGFGRIWFKKSIKLLQ
jgi:hypothetical protein